MVDEFSQAQVPGEGGRQEQAGIGHQAMVVKEDADTVGFVLWQHLLGAPCFRAGFCSKTIIPDSEQHPLASSRAVPKAVLRRFSFPPASPDRSGRVSTSRTTLRVWGNPGALRYAPTSRGYRESPTCRKTCQRGLPGSPRGARDLRLDAPAGHVNLSPTCLLGV